MSGVRYAFRTLLRDRGFFAVAANAVFRQAPVCKFRPVAAYQSLDIIPLLGFMARNGAGPWLSAPLFV